MTSLSPLIHASIDPALEPSYGSSVCESQQGFTRRVTLPTADDDQEIRGRKRSSFSARAKSKGLCQKRDSLHYYLTQDQDDEADEEETCNPHSVAALLDLDDGDDDDDEFTQHLPTQAKRLRPSWCSSTHFHQGTLRKDINRQKGGELLQLTQDDDVAGDEKKEVSWGIALDDDNKDPHRNRVPNSQTVDYTQDSTADEETYESFLLIDEHNGKSNPLRPNDEDGRVFTIGSTASCEVQCQLGKYRRQVKLVYNTITASFTLETNEYPCWILNCGKWKRVDPGSCQRIDVGSTFRLLPNPKHETMAHSKKSGEFTLYKVQRQGSVEHVGTASFDREYLGLLQHIKKYAKLQTNKKGPNLTLSESYQLVVNLRSDSKNLLPLTTLRYLYGGKAAIEEATWYLRGESNVRWLQQRDQRFWDEQAHADGWVGFNYGLLTNYIGINQLEDLVICPLIQNKSSRNMLCTLTKPNEPTVQKACTASVQFAVSQEDHGKEYLHLTVDQRSSDVILGLPHDVVVWTVILHFVRREVHRRSGRMLHAGKVYFNIAAGGTHVYMKNEEVLNQLLSRKPIPNVEPELVMNIDKGMSMFELAKTFGDKKVGGESSGGFEKAVLASMSSFDKMYATEQSKPGQGTMSHNNCPQPPLQIVGYTKERCHNPIKIEQAV